MTTRPTPEQIARGNKELRPQDILNAIVNDIPQLAQDLARMGLAREVK